MRKKLSPKENEDKQMSTVVERIFELMRENNIKPSELQRETELSNGIITQWKKGRSEPSSTSIKKIADYFNVTIDYLVNGEKNTKINNENEMIRLISSKINIVEDGLKAFFLLKENGNFVYVTKFNRKYFLNIENEQIKNLISYIGQERLEIFLDVFVCGDKEASNKDFPTEAEFEIMLFVAKENENEQYKEKITALRTALQAETKILEKKKFNPFL
ncbi:MAG: helix-turn-helix domain-containing protein [Defluviitaleaceae bacterium]|nr:helix-turn-helix domain-containing protein [Defluviitaleaceae bacterium]